MKIPFKKSLCVLVALATLCGRRTIGRSQVSLTVSPAVVGNTYSGVITLSLTGLPISEKVTVNRRLDLNGNGLIDAGEPLMDSFQIKDNDNSDAIIGGITNLNVPIDLNPAAHAITTALSFVPAQVLDDMVGRQIFRVTSPVGNFAPVTATLTVTNAATGQTVSGIIYSNDGVTPLPYAVVVAQDQQANNPAGATVADASGHYLLALVPGSYGLMAAFPNYYFNQKLAPSVTLTNGQSATNDMTLTNGTVTISGTVYDAGNSNGLGGLLLQMQSGKNFAIAFTDTNGSYSAAVSSNFWSVQPVKQRLVRRAYVLPNATFQPDASNGNVTNANIALPRGTALFYGRITDNTGAPFANVEVDASAGDGTTANSYDAKGYSDQNGYYTAAVLGDATNFWGCSATGAKNFGPLANEIVNGFGSVTFSPGQTAQQNFVALPATGTISGHVQDNAGTNVVGVGLNANATIDGKFYQSLDGTTDDSGNYSLAVAAGTWTVQFFTGNFNDSLDNLGYTDLTAPHFVSVPPTNAVLNVTVYPIGTPVMNGAGRFSPTQFGFTVAGGIGVSYTVQVSTNLADTNWANLSTFQLTSNNFPITDAHATNSLRFYRILKN